MKFSLYQNVIFWGITFIAIVSLWYFQYITTINIPWWDDFHGIMLPVSQLFKDDTFINKFNAFISLNNEHRVVNDRLFMLVIFLLKGGFDMKLLAIVGFVNLILILLLIYKVVKPNLNQLYYFLPVVFLIFQAQYFESLQSLMVPFQNFSVIFYVLLSIYFVIFSSKYNFLVALIFATAALFTHGNGILAFLIGGTLLFYQLKYQKAILWSIYMVILIAFYFYGYQKPTWTAENHSTLAQSFLYFFEFLGSYSLNFTDLSTGISTSKLQKIIPTIFGIIINIAFFGYLFRKYPIWKKDRNLYFTKLRHSKIDLFLIASAGFFIATGVLMGITRANFPVFSRYTINSALFLAFIYLFILFNSKPKKSIAILASTFTFITLIFSYLNNLDDAIYKKQNSITDGLNWQKNRTWINQYTQDFHIKNLNPLLTESYNNKTYVFPKTILSNLDFNKIYPVENQTIKIENEYLEIVENRTCPNPTNGEDGIYYVLKSSQNEFIFPQFIKNQNIKKMFESGKYFLEINKINYLLSNYPKGIYNLYKIVVSNNKVSVFKTNQGVDTQKMIVI